MIILLTFSLLIISSICLLPPFCTDRGIIATGIVIENNKDAMESFQNFVNTNYAGFLTSEKIKLYVASNNIPGKGICNSMTCLTKSRPVFRQLIDVGKLFKYNPEAEPGSLARTVLYFLTHLSWPTHSIFQSYQVLMFTQRSPKDLLEEFNATKTFRNIEDDLSKFSVQPNMLSADPELEVFEPFFRNIKYLEEHSKFSVHIITSEPYAEAYKKLFSNFKYNGAVVNMNDYFDVTEFKKRTIDEFEFKCKKHYDKHAYRKQKRLEFPLEEDNTLGILFDEKEASTLTRASPENPGNVTSVDSPVKATITATAVEPPVEATITATAVEAPIVAKKAYQDGLLDNSLPKNLSADIEKVDSEIEKPLLSAVNKNDSSTLDTFKQVGSTFIRDIGREIQAPLVGATNIDEPRTFSRATASRVVALADDAFDILKDKLRNNFTKPPDQNTTTTTTIDPMLTKVTPASDTTEQVETQPIYLRKWFIFLCVGVLSALLLSGIACFMRYRSNSGSIFPVTSLTVIDTNRDTDLEREQLTHSIHEAYA